jgi:hypothetical protein
MAKNYLKQLSLLNEQFSSYVTLRICFLTHLVPPVFAGFELDFVGITGSTSSSVPRKASLVMAAMTIMSAI